MAGTELHRPSDEAVTAHLHRLARSLQILADISLADVVVLVPTSTDGVGFRIIEHRRPINARTVYPDQVVGRELTARQRPLLHQAWTTGETFDGGVYLEDQDRWIRTLAVPVRCEGEPVAMLAREFHPRIEEIPGDLGLTMFAVLRRLAAMVADGTYPYPGDAREHDHPPRVGDGLMLLDAGGAVEYESPNATTVLRTMGVTGSTIGRQFPDLGVDASVVLAAYQRQRASFGEQTNGDTTMSVACLPLLEEGRVTGALTLLRDITELRHRDRLLLTKDATIAEIHHRVKNNLQTVSSLLNLQLRRMESDQGRQAVADSVRRIRAIAVVHEILSHKAGDEVSFGEIVQSLIKNVRDALIAPSQQITFATDVDDTILSSESTTTLAVVVSELLQNCIDHAFPETRLGPGEVRLSVARDRGDVVITVSDNGVGLPVTFGDHTMRLGLTIVETLVDSELEGTVRWDRGLNGGTDVVVRIPHLRAGTEGAGTREPPAAEADEASPEKDGEPALGR